MQDEKLPPRPPAEMKRYTAICSKPGDNPFRGRSVLQYTQTVDVAKGTPVAQVEQWAREAAKQGGYIFLRLEAQS